MATTATEIADKAMEKYRAKEAKTIPAAIWKALAAKGIVNSGDQKRLFDAASAELGRRGAATKAVARYDQKIQQKISA